MKEKQENGIWYEVDNIDEIDSPAMLIYFDRVVANIKTAIAMVNDIKRLRPHVKTHKTKEVAALMLDAGITKYKCATIAEAEMLAMINAPDVLLAYHPFGPKLNRFISLIKKYRHTTFSCLVDNLDSAKNIAYAALQNSLEIPLYLDLNVGQNRSGINPGTEAFNLYKFCFDEKGIKPLGLHAYDGHIRTKDLAERTAASDKAFAAVEEMKKQLVQQGFPEPIIIAGGSPTFPVHAKRKNVECSPGTFIYWDAGYQNICPEQNFLTAALVVSRVISLPDKNKICLDLGHKSIASENELSKRVVFLNAPDLTFIGHSEEHLVAEFSAKNSFKVGDILYGLPVHICPTVALYNEVHIVKSKTVTEEWKVIARDRKISV